MSKDLTNSEIAKLLRQVAAAFEIHDDNFFRVKAYQNAAVAIEHTGTHLKDLWQEGKIKDIPGVGPAIRQHLDELFQTGTVKHFVQETKDLPPGMFVLLGLPGFGPKTAYRLSKHFKLNDPKTAIDKLKKEAENGQIAALPGFGEKSQKDILDALTLAKLKSKEQKRMLLYEAEILSKEIVDYLKQSDKTLDVSVLGSQRRLSSTVGDIDLAVKTDDSAAIMSHILKYPKIQKIIGTGEKTTSFVHTSGKQVDIKTQSPAMWGSMLQHYTGSKLHNIHLRKLALLQGKSLSENGIKYKDKLHTFDNEKSFYSFIGLEYVPPALREDIGEIEAAQTDNIPNLVNLSDIKGDFHIHTDIDVSTSHDIGVSTVIEILEKAAVLNYEYLGLSDHNPRVNNLSIRDKKDILKRRNEIIDQQITSFEKKTGHKIKVFKGLEIDIRPDGELALEDELFDLIDYAVASVHSSFKQETEDATQRVLKALAHPKVKIFGHPSGRLIQKREGLDYYWDEIFTFCKKKNIAVEINSNPNRLDLSENLIRDAIKIGTKLIIDSDSHDVNQMDLIKYGVYNAQRGWAQASDVINTRTLKQFESFLK